MFPEWPGPSNGQEGRPLNHPLPAPVATRPEATPGTVALPVHTGHAQRPGPAELSTSLELDAVMAAPGYARSVLRAALDQWGLLRLWDNAEAISGEIVANAVAASVRVAPRGIAPAPVIFWVTVRDRELCLRAWDPDPTPPPGNPSLPGDGAESGRGLVIVDALSHRWDWYPTANGGKFTWAAISLDAPLPSG